MVVFGVDGNWYMHRVWYTIHGREHMTKQQISDIINSRILAMICSDANHVQATHLCTAFDGPQVFRYKIYPMYKANRNNGEAREQHEKGSGREIYEYLPPLIKYLKGAGLPVFQFRQYESDDVLASLAQLPTNVYLGSRDKDLYQVLKPNVKLVYSDKGVYHYIDVAKAEEVTGVKISQMTQYQALLGDSSDNIPQMKAKLGPKTVAKILQEYGSISRFYQNAKLADKEWLLERQHQLNINRKLVTLKRNVFKPTPSELVIQARSGNYPASYYQLTSNSSKLYSGSKASIKSLMSHSI